MHAQLSKQTDLTAKWLQMWKLDERRENPPQMANILDNVDYIKRYYIETAYAPTKGPEERTRAYKKFIYCNAPNTQQDDQRG
jgi:hypothetical protein